VNQRILGKALKTKNR